MMAANFGLLDANTPIIVGQSAQKGFEDAQGNALRRIAIEKHQRDVDEQENTRMMARAAGGDANKLYQMALSRGDIATAAAIAKMQAGQAESQASIAKDQAAMEKTRTETAGKRGELEGRAFGYLRQYPTPENAAKAIDWLQQQGVYSPEDAAAHKAKIPTDPAAIAALADEAYQRALNPDTQYQQLAQDARQQQQLAVQVRGQDLGAATAAMRTEAMLQRGKIANTRIPTGYRPTAAGDLEAIPGGPADYKRQAAAAQQFGAYETALSTLDDLAAQARALKDHPGLANITGIRGAIPVTMPGSATAGAMSELETLKSKTAIATLQAMRDASKTGGAVGQVTEAEWPRLESNIAALKTSQSVADYQANLQKLIDWAAGAKQRTMAAYSAQPDTGRAGSGGAVPAAPRRNASDDRPAAAAKVSPEEAAIRAEAVQMGKDPDAYVAVMRAQGFLQ